MKTRRIITTVTLGVILVSASAVPSFAIIIVSGKANVAKTVVSQPSGRVSLNPQPLPPRYRGR